MPDPLADALRTLIVDALPGLCGGADPPLQVGVTSGALDLDPLDDEAGTTDPRPDDGFDELPFDPAHPLGPYQLSRPPYPGPRRVRLVTADGDRVALTDAEVTWDPTDAVRFSLRPRPDRDLTAVSGVEVRYGVVAVFTTVRATRTLDVLLALGDLALVAEAEALVVAVIELNRERLATDAQYGFTDGGYGAAVTVKRLRLTGSTAPADGRRLLTVLAQLELKASRALTADEGKPIERIRTPGRPLDPNRPIDVAIDVQA